MKKYFIGGIIFFVLMSLPITLNYLIIQSPVNKKINSDGRNIGIELSVHTKYYLLPNVLVVDLNKFSKSNSASDVVRCLLQIAYVLREKDFKTIQLQHNGVEKFTLNGIYFRKLGSDYEFQNPTATILSFTENVLTIEGTKAYPKEYTISPKPDNDALSELKDFTDKWFFADLN